MLSGIVALVVSSRTPAADDVVAIVSAKSPVTGLTKNQVMDLFLGRASHFPDGAQALPLDQFEGSAVRDEFYERFAGKSAAQVKAHWSRIIFTGKGQPPKEIPGSAEVKRLVVENPRAIGYVERSQVDGNVRVLLSQ
jgi:ABC-type phosphate transport system substrate-binding protein